MKLEAKRETEEKVNRALLEGRKVKVDVLDLPRDLLVDRIARRIARRILLAELRRAKGESLFSYCDGVVSLDDSVMDELKEQARFIIEMVRKGEPRSEGERAALEALGRREGLVYK